MIYLLNSPILTAYGVFRFEGPIAADEARARLGAGFTSAIGHAESAAFLSALLGLEVPANRISIQMAAGDEALVLRLGERLPETRVLTAEEMERFPFELGWLRRLS